MMNFDRRVPQILVDTLDVTAKIINFFKYGLRVLVETISKCCY